MESSCKYVNSRGILKSCDIYSSTPISSIERLVNYDFSNLVDKSIVYVCISAIPYFYKVIFPQLQNNIILVTGDGDNTCPTDFKSEFENMIDSNKIIHWFSQNCMFTHPKLSQIPIGLDYHTMSNKDTNWGSKISQINQETILENIKNNSKPFYERNIKIYSNFHFAINSYDRKDAMNQINADLIYYEPLKIERTRTWENQSKYAFVASPHGCGYDCHGTWEALSLGCCPIVKTSALDPLYENLPVLIVKEWSMLTYELLENTLKEFETKVFNYDKLNLNYWMNKIKSYKGQTRINQSIIIAGCCINVERYIKKNLFIMDEIGKQFKDYKIIIYENDSTDNTRKILMENKKEHYEYIFEDGVNIPNRTMRIAHCRNKLLEKIDTSYDYLLMLDLDDVLYSGKLIDTIKTCFYYKIEQWDAMFANCSKTYYDIFALRKKKYLTSCCWNDANLLKSKGTPHKIAYELCINKFIIHYPPEHELISVLSAFGGAGLYKMKSIIGCKYDGYEKNHITGEICEHVTFNQALIHKGCKLYINPKMLIM